MSPSEVHLRWSLAVEAGMGPEMVVTHAEQLEIVVAVGQLVVDGLEKAFDLAAGGRAVDAGAYVDDVPFAAPAVKSAMFAGATIG